MSDSATSDAAHSEPRVVRLSALFLPFALVLYHPLGAYLDHAAFICRPGVGDHVRCGVGARRAWWAVTLEQSWHALTMGRYSRLWVACYFAAWPLSALSHLVLR